MSTKTLTALAVACLAASITPASAGGLLGHVLSGGGDGNSSIEATIAAGDHQVADVSVGGGAGIDVDLGLGGGSDLDGIALGDVADIGSIGGDGETDLIDVGDLDLGDVTFGTGDIYVGDINLGDLNLGGLGEGDPLDGGLLDDNLLGDLDLDLVLEGGLGLDL